MKVSEYLNLESARDGTYDTRKIRNGIDFLSDFNPNLLSEVEIEMCIMHVALIIDDRNTFKNNYNIVGNKELFIDHVSLIKGSDITSWCRKLYDSAFWMHGDRIIVNLVFNWLNNSFNSPERIIA